MDFDINSLMQQAQAMQEKMKKMQDEAANAEVTGESGAGLVKVTMNGRHDVKGVDIDASLMSEDKELLEDLLAAAVNDAVRRVESSSRTTCRIWPVVFPFRQASSRKGHCL